MSLNKKGLFLGGLLVALVAFVAAGCGGGGGGGAPEALPSSSCTAIEYEGDGDPDYLLVSDLPLQGASRTQTVQIVNAIRYELKQAGFKAGDYKVGFQSCDDATAQAGKWDSGKCSENANAYAANDKVIGIIGTFNSGCAGIIIPVVNQAPDGGIAMLSPANTYVCLTQGGPGCDKTEPDKYYPSGTRNYARVVANDGYQGAADAEFAQDARRQERVHPERQGGIRTRGRHELPERGEVARDQGRRLRGLRPEGVVLRGAVQQHQGDRRRRRLHRRSHLRERRAADQGQGRRARAEHRGQVAHPGRLRAAGNDRRRGLGVGGHVHVGRRPADRQVPGWRREFAENFSKEFLGGKTVDPYAIYGAQAATVMFDAIAASDGSRGDVISKMFATEVQNGLLGSFKFNENGDPAQASGAVTAIVVYKATDKLETAALISPKQSTVDAALGQ